MTDDLIFFEEPNEFRKLFDKCPTNASRMLLSMIIDLNIDDLEILKEIANRDFTIHCLVKIAYDDLINYRVIDIIPSFRLNADQKWEIYNKIVLNKE